MKKYNKYLMLTMFALIASFGCNRVNEKDSDFENVVYIENAKNTNIDRVMLKANTSTMERVIKAGMALPKENDIRVRFKADISLVEMYNKVNYTESEPLPAANYNLSSNEVLIPAGNIISSDITVLFKDLEDLPRNKSFVLPVSIEAANGISILNGAKTMYYILRKGAAITTVANMTENYIDFQSMQTSTVLDSLSEITFEGLLRPTDLPNSPKTFLGIEGYCLLRIGDVPPLGANQLQFAGPGNYNTGLYMTANKWHHVAFTYDIPGREIIVYLDGEEVSRTTAAPSFASDGNVVNLGRGRPADKDAFYVGRSYDNTRYFRGDMSEVRVWNVIRTPEEIAANMYGVEPDTPGLMAYWKMDEGSGRTIRDHSGHGLEGTAVNNVTWRTVELPPEN